MPLSDYFKNPAVQAAYTGHSLYNRSRHLEMLSELDRSQFYSEERLREIQLAKLRRLLKIALHHSPFWRKRFSECGFCEADIAGLESLDKLPRLRKTDIIHQRDSIVVDNVDRSKLIENKSGGTTGSPLSYYLDSYKADVREAATLRHNLWSGYRVGHKLAAIWGASSDLNNAISLKTNLREIFWGRQIFLNSSNISEKTFSEFIAAWNKFKPDILLGYSGALEYFAKYLNENNFSMPPPKAIIASAEVLSLEARRTIEAFWGVPIFERYGCREVSVIASECVHHSGLHINAENLLLDFETIEELDNNRILAKIRITDLENLVFPFIRYELGDLVMVSQIFQPCPCGRGLPRIEAVAGRVSDYIKLKDGRHISGTGLTISLLSKAPGILKTQIVQKDWEKLLVRIVRNEKFDEVSLNILREEFARLVGERVQLDFEFPDRIEREPSGKYRLVISEVSD